MAEQVGINNTEETGPNIEEAVKYAVSLACDKEASQIKLTDRITVDLRCQTDELLRSAKSLSDALGFPFNIGDFKRSRTVGDLVRLSERYYEVNK